MKGPMKGATIGHSKQRIVNGRYLGVTEPGIIAAESPNPIVSQLVIMPDIEKRLEAFVRLGHGIVIFPGGAGTAEEILYLLGILLDPANSDMPFPVVFTGPADCEDVLPQIHDFIGATLGRELRSRAIRSSSTTRPGWRGPWCTGSRRFVTTDGARATPTASTGCSTFRSSSSFPSR